METYQAIILGILQGITEFIPISSSGHLVLGQHFFGITEPVLAFDISVHMGTLAATVLVFFTDIKALMAAGWKAIRSRQSSPSEIKLLLLIAAGCLPTAAMGLLLKQWEHIIFSSVMLVGFMLLVTGTLLWFTKKVGRTGYGITGFNYRTALLIGLCQGLAVIPGISRSGITISAGLFAGIDRRLCARFSFLLSIPAIAGAQLLTIKDSFSGPALMTSPVVYGTIAAFITGLGALLLLLKIVNNGRFHIFAPYCWIVGIISILSTIF